ncbi:MAG TPA: glycosyltransferase [Pyrinomonadaceae bacterium]|nr:glycosyltransferase [Pyrinomonadaceae bacterium]
MIPSQTLSSLSAISLGVVCPMANESKSAVRFVMEVLATCNRFSFKSVNFFAIVDNVSTDNTRALLDTLSGTEPQLHVVWAPENRNVVDAYTRGYREALGGQCDWILEIDAGYSHQPADIPQFFAEMSKGYDCVFGTRFAKGGSVLETSPQRRLISYGGSIVTNLFLGTRLSDMTSGFELFSRPALQKIIERGIKSRGPFFHTEIKTYCRGLRWVEVPIHYRAASHNITSASLKDAFASLWRLFRLRITGGL